MFLSLFLDCTYEVGVYLTFSTGASINTTREALILEGEGYPNFFFFFFFLILLILFSEVPVIRFDDVTSSCSTEGGNGDIYLQLGPVEGLGEGDEVVDYLWNQVKGGEVGCVERFVINIIKY